jgi:hypothetical protein
MLVAVVLGTPAVSCPPRGPQTAQEGGFLDRLGQVQVPQAVHQQQDPAGGLGHPQDVLPAVDTEGGRQRGDDVAQSVGTVPGHDRGGRERLRGAHAAARCSLDANVMRARTASSPSAATLIRTVRSSATSWAVSP